MTRKKKTLEPLTIEQLDKLKIELLKPKTNSKKSQFIAVRNAFLVYFSMILGLRPKEAYDGKISFLDFEKGLYYIPSENNKQRFQDYQPIPNDFIKEIKAYLLYRAKFYPCNHWLFPTSSKRGRIERSYYNKVFRQALKNIGSYHVSYVDGQGNKRSSLTPYSLRCSYGSIIYTIVKDLNQTRIALRHRDLLCRTTLNYVRLEENQIRRENINKLYLKINPSASSTLS